MTTIYLLRHSQPFRKLLGEYNVNEVEQLRNEKNPLSVKYRCNLFISLCKNNVYGKIYC